MRKTTKMFRSIVTACSVIAVFTAFQTKLNATVITFERITNNAPNDIAIQLSAIVTSVDANHVKFEFHNTAIIQSSIAEIYFDDGGPDAPILLDSFTEILNHNTLFESNAIPANLPAWHTLTPVFSADFAAQAQIPSPQNGVNESTDHVGLVFKLILPNTFDEIITALENGPLRIGLHVQSIGLESQSDSFVSVPEPATIALLSLGALSLVRRKNNV